MRAPCLQLPREHLTLAMALLFLGGFVYATATDTAFETQPVDGIQDADQLPSQEWIEAGLSKTDVILKIRGG